jgi:hypothetical protein
MSPRQVRSQGLQKRCPAAAPRRRGMGLAAGRRTTWIHGDPGFSDTDEGGGGW